MKIVQMFHWTNWLCWYPSCLILLNQKYPSPTACLRAVVHPVRRFFDGTPEGGLITDKLATNEKH
jgi:hypothetical protein